MFDTEYFFLFCIVNKNNSVSLQHQTTSNTTKVQSLSEKSKFFT